jgi:hypothetical protein
MAMLLAAAPFTFAQGAPPVAEPGTINYVEGIVQINGKLITKKQVGSIEVAQGGVLSTANGRAEMLLTPGVYMRLDSNSALTMVSPELTHTTIQLTRGELLAEVDQIEKENRLEIAVNGVTTRLLKTGVYEFHTDPPSVAVFTGKAEATEGRHVFDAYRGEQILLTPQVRHAVRKFHRKAPDDLYAWSKLRSEYAAEAGENMAQEAALGTGPYGWYGPGWFWDPYFDMWGFFPMDAYMWGPFGFPFYSPLFYGGGYGYYGYGRYGYRGGGVVTGSGSRGTASGAFLGGMGGFRGGMGGFHGGGGRR